jgi:hypothetical protein
MIENRAFVVIAVTAALGFLGVTSALSATHHDDTGGHVKPCSLHGVNPAHHPSIFGDPDTARDHYGFVKSSEGKWRVEADCRKHGHRAELSVPGFLQRI